MVLFIFLFYCIYTECLTYRYEVIIIPHTKRSKYYDLAQKHILRGKKFLSLEYFKLQSNTKHQE